MDLINKKILNSRKNEYRMLFIIGCLIGILCFLCIYGTKILDFTYTGWLMNGDMDLRQHFLGWCHFRTSDWHIPIGLIDSLSYPTNVSIIWTDSIPLFAVIFKLFRGVLPEAFQYFGLFGILCFALQGGISILIIRRFTENRTVCIVSVPFFTLSFTLLQRMYYHTALAAQWLILLAVLLWIYDEWMDSIWKKCLIWFGMGFLCVSIHSYFVPMVGMIMLGSLVDSFWKKRMTQTGSKLSQDLIYEIFAPTGVFCLAVLLNLFLLGAFYQSASPVGEGIGAFCSNLNTFFNSMGHSTMLKGLPVYGEFQYEGFAYLGAGMLMLAIRVLVLVIRYFVKHHTRINKDFIRQHRRNFLFVMTAVISMILAVFPTVSFGAERLFGVPYFGPFKTLMNIFRSNGRFIWVAMYLLMICVLVLIIREQQYFPFDDRKGRSQSVKKNDGGSMVLLLVMALLLQFADASGWMVEKRVYFAKDTHSFESVWEKAEDKIAGKKQFVFMYDENDWIMDTAYYAYEHDMTQNNYYYARSYADQINATIDQYRKELEQGKVREDTVYVFRKSDLKNVQYQGIKIEALGDHMIGIASP